MRHVHKFLLPNNTWFIYQDPFQAQDRRSSWKLTEWKPTTLFNLKISVVNSILL